MCKEQMLRERERERGRGREKKGGREREEEEEEGNIHETFGITIPEVDTLVPG